MTLFDTIMQLDWTRATRVGILVGTALTTLQAACLFRRALINHPEMESKGVH
ncbi:hypothetical protein [Caballeronia sp. LZ043]|uniref:hypothetical protein n=1 Tax=Caballeronia sp. LZ043 TaxID=3038569 RepID=UPI00286335C1|nr:hypothetical protein [Caballeronia sp. LZ043]MDR5826023.1 hypothetical protein [Caballeronia sp. LZ043]